MKAVKRFNPDVGVRLVSFAVHWIKAEIHEYVLKIGIVKVATTKSQRKLFFNLRKSKQRLGWFSADEVGMVAQELGVSEDAVKEMEMGCQRMTWRSTYHLITMMSFPALYLEDKPIMLAYRTTKYRESLSNSVIIRIKTLDERSQHILQTRWLDEQKMTLHDLAAHYNVSAERIRQIEKTALTKLKNAMI